MTNSTTCPRCGCPINKNNSSIFRPQNRTLCLDCQTEVVDIIEVEERREKP